MSITEQVAKAAEIYRKAEEAHDEIQQQLDKIVGKVTHKLIRADHHVEVVSPNLFTVDGVIVYMPVPPYYVPEDHSFIYTDASVYQLWTSEPAPSQEPAKTLSPDTTEDELEKAILEVLAEMKKEKDAESV